MALFSGFVPRTSWAVTHIQVDATPATENDFVERLVKAIERCRPQGTSDVEAFLTHDPLGKTYAIDLFMNCSGLERSSADKRKIKYEVVRLPWNNQAGAMFATLTRLSSTRKIEILGYLNRSSSTDEVFLLRFDDGTIPNSESGWRHKRFDEVVASVDSFKAFFEDCIPKSLSSLQTMLSQENGVAWGVDVFVRCDGDKAIENSQGKFERVAKISRAPWTNGRNYADQLSNPTGELIAWSLGYINNTESKDEVITLEYKLFVPQPKAVNPEGPMVFPHYENKFNPDCLLVGCANGNCKKKPGC